MVAEIGTLGAIIWWLGLAAFYFVVVPSVVLLANRVVSALQEIKAYAEDVLEHGVGLAGTLDPIPELVRTRDLTRQVAEGVERYAAAVGRLGGRGERWSRS